MIPVKFNSNQRHDYFSITSIIVYFNNLYIYIFISLYVSVKHNKYSAFLLSLSSAPQLSRDTSAGEGLLCDRTAVTGAAKTK